MGEDAWNQINPTASACVLGRVGGEGEADGEMDGERWLPAGADTSGPSVALTCLPRQQYLNANGWDTGWGGARAGFN